MLPPDVTDIDLVIDNLQSFQNKFCKEYSIFQVLEVTRTKDNKVLSIIYKSLECKEESVVVVISVNEYDKWLDSLVNQNIEELKDCPINNL